MHIIAEVAVESIVGRIELNIYDAFTEEVFGGNIAGVVSHADELSEAQMQVIARETNVSATVFVTRSDEADFSARFFTPNLEINMCGHGLVAACTQLYQEGRIVNGAGDSADFSIQTNAQRTKGRLRGKGEAPLIMIEQSPPLVTPCEVNHASLSEALGIDPGRIDNELPIATASGALNHLLVPVAGLETLAALKPDFTALARLSHELGAISIDVFALEAENPKAFVRSRDFCPAAGIPEAPGSGTTNSALFCYLIQQGILSASNDDTVSMCAEQGYEMNRPSQIQCEAKIHNGEIEDLKVGGTAVMSIAGFVCMPDAKSRS